MTAKEAIQSLIRGHKICVPLWDKHNYLQLDKRGKCLLYSQDKPKEVGLVLLLTILADAHSFVFYEEPFVFFKDVPIGENLIYNRERLIKVKDDGNRNVIGFEYGKPNYTGYLADLSKVKYPVTSQEFDESA